MKMLRIISLFAATMVIVFVATSCNNKEKYEPSTVILDEEAVNFLSVSVKEASSDEGIFILENCCEQVVSYGDRNILEKNIDGEWKGVVEYNSREMTEPSYELESKKSVEYRTEWGALDKGEYRYVILFTVAGDESIDLRRVYYTAISFSI